MDIDISIQEENMIFTFPQRMDSAASTEVLPDILKKIEQYKNNIVFDLKQVNYISSAFLRICLTVCKNVGTEKFCCLNVSPSVKKVFKIAGFDDFMKID